MTGDLVGRVFLRVSLVRMVGAKPDRIQINALLPQQCLQLFVDILHILHPAEAPGHHRLIGHQDGKIPGPVDLSNGLNGAVLQFKLLLFPDQPIFPVDCPIPVQKDRLLLPPEAPARNMPTNQVLLYACDPLHRSHILDVLRGVVGVDPRPCLQHPPKEVLLQVEFLSKRDPFAGFFLQNIKPGVDTIVIPSGPDIVLGIENLDPILAVTDHQVRIKGMGVWMDEQGRLRLLLLMKRQHPGQVDLKQDIPEHQEKGISGQQRRQHRKGSGGPQRDRFFYVPDGDTEPLPIAKKLPYLFPQIPDDQDYIGHTLLPKALDLPL